MFLQFSLGYKGLGSNCTGWIQKCICIKIKIPLIALKMEIDKTVEQYLDPEVR